MAVAVAALAVTAAGAQTMYKWIEADGKTQYSDKPPKNFKGEVTRIEADVNPPAVIVPLKTEVPKADGARDIPSDYLANKRAKRAELEAIVSSARANLDAAQKALAASSDPQADELQVVQSRGDNNGGRSGAQVARSNCHVAILANGRKTTVCPGIVPRPEYYERIAQLEEAVRKAQADLDAAEDAYRRGVD